MKTLLKVLGIGIMIIPLFFILYLSQDWESNREDIGYYIALSLFGFLIYLIGTQIGRTKVDMNTKYYYNIMDIQRQCVQDRAKPLK